MFTKLEGEKIPLVSIGTSPFIGAGQFGARAAIWRREFLENPNKMHELMDLACEKGAKGVEVIPVGKIPDAASMTMEKNLDFSVLGSTSWDSLKIEVLSELKAKIIFVHGSFADRRNKSFLEETFAKIRKAEVIPGIATHEPLRTIPFIIESKLDCPAILVPFNAEGFIMDNKNQLEDLVDKTGDKIFYVGMKTLAAGKVPPKEAYDYISKHEISAITVGLTSKNEISETVPIALKSLSSE